MFETGKTILNPLALGTAVLMAAWGLEAQAQGADSQGADRPNVLVILVDDMGWSDIGPFGAADVATPHLDALAERGVRMSNFHVSPICSPTRAMLLTGSDSHEVGLGNLIELVTPEQEGQPGYEGYFNDRAVTVAERLRDDGYWTVMAGKWHLGLTEAHSPAAHGFDRSFAMMRGEANQHHYAGLEPSPDGADLYRLDGVRTSVEPDFYSTDTYVEYLNDFIDERPEGAPFFAYLSFTAPHSPLQAPPDVIAKYRGAYDDGPRALAEARLAHAKDLGVLEDDVTAHPFVAVPDWSSFPEDERTRWSRRMEVYAAMIDRMDEGIGRVIDDLRRQDEYDDTLIFFLSDNGAAGGLREASSKWGPWIEDNFDNSLENMGSGTSYISTGPMWAQASMSPAALFKGYTSEGGTLSPLIAAGPGVAEGGLSGRFGDVKDIVPTILAATGTDARTRPDTAPIRGRSLLDVLARPVPERVGPAEANVLELAGGRAVHRGKWKAVLLTSQPKGLPVEQLPLKRWLLFDTVEDPGETTDLADEHPDVLAELAAAYDAYAEEVGIVALPDMLDEQADR